MRNSAPIAGGALAAIGGTALKLTATPLQLNNGIYIEALTGNGQTVYVGIVGVTTATGFPLVAGAISPLIGCVDPSTIFVIAPSGSNEVRWIGW